MIMSSISGLLGLLAFVFWLWMLIDAIKNPSLSNNQRIVWVLVIVFVVCIGPVAYFFVAKSK